jgi:hypothetical protein
VNLSVVVKFGRTSEARFVNLSCFYVQRIENSYHGHKMQEQVKEDKTTAVFSKAILDRLEQIFIDSVNQILNESRRGRTPPNRKDFPENLLEAKLPRYLLTSVHSVALTL